MTRENAQAKPIRKDTLRTRQRIIDAAEYLFAEHGIDNVTLLEIARAAGQKNRGALQYHFGDKWGLINAVLDKHSDQISIHRRNMLQRISKNSNPSLKELVEAYVLPVALHVDTTENRLAFLLINCQIMTSREFAALALERASKYPEIQQLATMMKTATPSGSKKQSDFKILMIRSMVFHGLAAYYGSGESRLPQSLIDTLCTSVMAVLASE